MLPANIARQLLDYPYSLYFVLVKERALRRGKLTGTEKRTIILKYNRAYEEQIQLIRTLNLRHRCERT